MSRSLQRLLVAAVVAWSAAGWCAGGVVCGDAPAPPGVRVLRVYVAGESIEQRNRFVEPPFTAIGTLHARGAPELRNDNDEYGWMVPFADRLRLRAGNLAVRFVGSGKWIDASDDPSTGTYPCPAPQATSAISGTSVPSWLEQRRGELERKALCYDVAFAARGGNDFGYADDADYQDQLKGLLALLAHGSSCRADPLVIVTGHMPDDQRFGKGPPGPAYVAIQMRRFVTRARAAVDAFAAENPGARVRFIDMYTPFLTNRKTTAFPDETWSRGGVPDYEKIGREGELMHPRRLASIYAGEIVADAMDLDELRRLPP